MAEIHGNQGAVFQSAGYLSDDGFAFVDSDPDTITHDLNGFITGGFVAGDTINVSGTDSNDDDYTIDAGGVAAGTLTLIGGDTLTPEAAGDDVVIQTEPGTQLGGFFNWTISWEGEVHDVTDFADGTARTFISGLTAWTATTEKYWQTGAGVANQGSAPGSEVVLRFFVIYTATPNITTNYYYEGTGIITSVSPTTPVDEIVKGTMAVQGTGALVFTTRSTAWG